MARPDTEAAGDTGAVTRRRGTFGPVTLAGLAAGALLAVAGAHAWVGYTVRPAVDLVGSDVGQVPLAGALAYLLLASWGVLLVTRGVVRRAFAVVAALASAGLAATVVWAVVQLPDDVRSRFPGTGYRVDTSLSGWFWVALVGVLVSLAATVLAVRLVPTWPEMGSRYDAPADAAGSATASAVAPATDPDDPEAGNLELWKAIDRGDDPTA